ncbi:MAG: hypothetical protein AABZ53_02690, partial [Planctomycetota bacterium]
GGLACGGGGTHSGVTGAAGPGAGAICASAPLDIHASPRTPATILASRPINMRISLNRLSP